MEGDLERFFLKMNKSAVENAMKLAENDDENVVEMAKITVENAGGYMHNCLIIGKI